MDMHRAEFGAALQRGDGFAGVEQSGGIKRGFYRVKLVQFRAAELQTHLVYFFDADAMFAGNGAADFDAQMQNALAEFFGARQFARLIGVEQDQRMQVAVSGVEYIGYRQAIFLRPLADLAKLNPYKL